jgi:hypothetical protein
MYQEKNVAKILLHPVFCIAIIIRIIENVGRNSIRCIFAKDLTDGDLQEPETIKNR